jgi:hypothetical protein
MLSVKCDIDGPIKGLEQMLGEDLPFTIARFLTMQAQSGQEAARQGERNVFKLRNDWTTQNTKITPATKKTMFSEVYTDTSNRKSGAPDYLPRQDEGGDKVPVAGHRFLAIPTRYLRRVAPGAIPDALRPKNLLPPGVEIGVEYQGNFTVKGAPRPRRGLGKAIRTKLATNDYVAFVQMTGGTLCIFVRHGGMGYGGSHDAEPWYTLIREAHISARFPMEELVQQAVDANLERNFTRAAAEVLVNNLLKSGFRVNF